MKILYRFSLLLFIFCSGIYAKASEIDNPFSKKFSYADDLKIGLFHRDGSGIGYNKGYSSLRLFYIPKVEKFTPFIDFRLHIFNDGRPASNIGLGVRKLVGPRCLLGLNGFYDYRSSKKLDTHQIGAGFEFLMQSFELYMNGYIPFGKKIFDDDPAFDHFVGRELIVSQARRGSLAHVDLLARYRMYKNCDSHITPGIGGYYLFRRGKSFGRMGNALGIKGQIRAQLLRYLNIGFDLSYDKIFKMRYEGTLGLSFPLNIKKRKRSKCKAKFSHCFLQRDIQRDEIIPIEKKKIEYPLINPLTNEPYQFIFVNNDSGSNGTFEDPFPTITEAINAAYAHDIIYVFPGSALYEEDLTLKDTLRLQGSGHSFTIQGVTIPALTANVPHIVASIVEIRPANNNIINGFQLANFSGNTAIFGSNIENCTIQNCTVFGSGVIGGQVFIRVLGNAQILDNTILTPTDFGLGLRVSVLSATGKAIVERNNVDRDSFIGLGSSSVGCLRLRNNRFVRDNVPKLYSIFNFTVESPDGTEEGVEALNQGNGNFSNVTFSKKICQ